MIPEHQHHTPQSASIPATLHCFARFGSGCGVASGEEGAFFLGGVYSSVLATKKK